jgi:hypothetical protein
MKPQYCRRQAIITLITTGQITHVFYSEFETKTFSSLITPFLIFYRPYYSILGKAYLNALASSSLTFNFNSTVITKVAIVLDILMFIYGKI